MKYWETVYDVYTIRHTVYGSALNNAGIEVGIP